MIQVRKPYVIIEPKSEEQIIDPASGIIMPPIWQDDNVHYGTVYSAFEGSVVKEGDTVVFGRWNGEKFKHEGKELLYMWETELWAIVDGGGNE